MIENNKNNHYFDVNQMTCAIQKSVSEALLVHKINCNPVPAWKEGRIVWLKPEELDV